MSDGDLRGARRRVEPVPMKPTDDTEATAKLLGLRIIDNWQDRGHREVYKSRKGYALVRTYMRSTVGFLAHVFCESTENMLQSEDDWRELFGQLWPGFDK